MKQAGRKAFLSLVFAASMALAACGAPTATPPADGGDGGTAGGEQVVLTMHSWRVEDTAGYEKIIQAFEAENPGIKIEFKPFKATEYNTILNTALSSDSGPDIMQLRPYGTGMALAEAGYLEPLDQLPGIDKFAPEVLAAATAKDGKVYGVPLSLNTTQVYYNKKIFEQHGLKEPKSWEEFLAICRTLKEKGVTPIAFGAKEGWLLSLSHGVIAPGTYNGNTFAEKLLNGEANFTSPEFVKSLERMNELVPYFPENFTGLDLNDIRALFFTEQAAMFINGSFELEVLQKNNPDLQLDFFPMPTDSGDTVITSWVDGSYGVNAKSKHKQEALKFLEFMTTEKFGQLFANELKRISAVPGVQTNDPLINKMADLAGKKSTPYLMVVYFNEGQPPTKVVLENSLQGMYLGQLSPAQVAEEVQKSAASWFAPFQK